MANNYSSFVENMLRSAKETKKETKPESLTNSVNPADIERITNNLREKIQKRK